MPTTRFPPDKVLVAIDHSPPSRLALAYAARISRVPGTALSVLHVGPPGMDPETAAAARAATLQDLEAEAPGHRADVVVEEGDPAQRIAMFAQQHDPDLVIVGSHGRTGISRALLGSVAERVARLCPAPVLIVRPDPDGTEETMPPFPPRRVLAPTDFSEQAQRGLRWVGRLAEQTGCAVSVLHVRTENRAHPLELEAELTAEIARAGLPPESERVVVGGPPAATIGTVAERLGAELVVVGSHGRTGAARIVLGSVAERTARLAHCPVLIVK